MSALQNVFDLWPIRPNAKNILDAVRQYVQYIQHYLIQEKDLKHAEITYLIEDCIWTKEEQSLKVSFFRHVRA